MITGPFIVVSGLPGGGKSALSRQLGSMLDLSIVDKDDILEASFTRAAPIDPEERFLLSRRADGNLRKRAEYLGRAILVSFWRRPELSATSGTPTEWIARLPQVIEVHCTCAPETAATRFLARSRHPGHGDADKDPGEILAQFQGLAALGPLGVGPLVEVSTETAPSITPVLRDIRSAVRSTTEPR